MYIVAIYSYGHDELFEITFCCYIMRELISEKLIKKIIKWIKDILFLEGLCDKAYTINFILVVSYTYPDQTHFIFLILSN